MEFYYGLMFFILIWLQGECKGFIATSFCLLLLLSNNTISPFLENVGFDFFESSLLVDVLFLILSATLIRSYIGKVLVCVFTFSILINLIPNIITDQDIYGIFVRVYRWLNILLFEVLLWTCITTTIIYPWMKRKSQYYRMR